MQLVKIFQHDIKYKTLAATLDYLFAQKGENNDHITSMTIFWNDGDPHASLDPRPGTNPCPAPQRDDKHKYNPATDRWKLNIVEGETKERFHGKWMLVSNYDDKSDINITSLWHKLKDKIEAGEVAVIKMECPPPALHDSHLHL